MRPPVDIIIPFHGQYESLVATYVAVQSCTPNQEYRVFLVDDCSPNRDFLADFTAGRRKTFGVRLDRQSGFGAAVNAGYAAGAAPLVAVLHSDVRPLNVYWLYHMQKVLATNRGVKLVSARLDDAGTAGNYPACLLAGDADVEAADQPLPLTCCLMHRGLFAAVGGLRPYPYGWFEDEEFFHRMRAAGHGQAVAARARAAHGGGRTITALLSARPELEAVMAANAEACRRDLAGLGVGT